MSGTGYGRPVIKLDFTAELGSGPDDPIWVVIKNPKLLPPKMLRASKAAVAAAEAIQSGDADEDTEDEGLAGTHAMCGRLVVAWRVYATPPAPEIDPLTGDFTAPEPELLPALTGGGGATAEQFGALPAAIQMAVFREITEALNPQRAQGAPT